MTWDDLNNLSAAQKAKAAQFAAIGASITPITPTPDISAVTYSQAKAALLIIQEMEALIRPAIKGVNYVLKINRDAALASFDQANP